MACRSTCADLGGGRGHRVLAPDRYPRGRGPYPYPPPLVADAYWLVCPTNWKQPTAGPVNVTVSLALLFVAATVITIRWARHHLGHALVAFLPGCSSPPPPAGPVVRSRRRQLVAAYPSLSNVRGAGANHHQRVTTRKARDRSRVRGGTSSLRIFGGTRDTTLIISSVAFGLPMHRNTSQNTPKSATMIPQ